MPFVINAHPPTDHPYSGDAEWRIVSPGYFDTFRIPQLRGRLFTDRDDSGAAPVVLISETMAKEFWPQSDPLGELITIGGKFMGPEFEEPPRQIIGVVADVRDIGLNTSPEPTMYVPIPQLSDGITAILSRRWSLTWAVRTKVAPYTLNAAVQRELRAAAHPGLGRQDQALSWSRPLRLRAARMARPARVRMRSRKPCVFARRRLFGWNVRLLTGAPGRDHVAGTLDVGVRFSDSPQVTIWNPAVWQPCPADET